MADLYQQIPALADVEARLVGLLEAEHAREIQAREKDLETEIKEISQMGVKHVLLVAFDQEDQMHTGRITGTVEL